ncbi:hypothetical protein FACS1894207_2550 [Bacteroidia bacterium]|nr:hypothetical protein FACS1894207_2550 [Bacteroidia bacterium]
MANNISDSIIGKTVKTVLAIFTVTILTLTFGCNSDDPSAEDLMPTYSIGGTITKSNGGAMAEATVQLQTVTNNTLGFHSEGFLMNSSSLNITTAGDAIDAI